MFSVYSFSKKNMIIFYFSILFNKLFLIIKKDAFIFEHLEWVGY